ncbi:RrF2 family transcriptional regulator [Ruegeria atlantica]|uniref:RrF2 family transcriptional regulator n=1 Tax=Ruegeria atlantica TaxID=81569 RepID=UPI00147D672A|nr:Rrf2 family transcriptional regulator [Ruegeria atlantica]
MSYFGANVEYGIHCLLHLVEVGEIHPSSRELAEFQGVSPSYVAKVFTKLRRSGLVESTDGIAGGYRLAKPAAEISVLDIVEALDGYKPAFQCREIRRSCVLYRGQVPDWAGRGICAVHAVMKSAEQKMKQELARTSLEDIKGRVNAKAPVEFGLKTEAWFEEQVNMRRTGQA